jgi:CRP-like cAMP-binding protein
VILSRCEINAIKTVAPPPAANQLLAALSVDEQLRLSPHLEPVELPLGRSVYEPGDRMSHVFFPTSGIVARLYPESNGASTEVALKGKEGVVGISTFLGGGSTTCRAVVIGAVRAYRLPKLVLQREFERGGSLQHVLLRYAQALLTQIAQNAVCNRHHSIDQQLCRWLLLNLDRSSSGEVHMTQESIATMLGVRREGVTEAAGRLKDSALIQSRRGRITVLDRPGLEKRVCECYTVVRRESDRLAAWKPWQRALRFAA